MTEKDVQLIVFSSRERKRNFLTRHAHFHEDFFTKLHVAQSKLKLDLRKRLKSNTVELLSVTTQHALDYEEYMLRSLVTSDTHRTCFNFKKRDNESLSDCTISLKVAREILQSLLIGTNLVEKLRVILRVPKCNTETRVLRPSTRIGLRNIS